MPITRRIAPLFVALLLSVPAFAGGGTHIEIIATIESEAAPPVLEGACVIRVVLDASAPPISDNGRAVRFELVEGQFSVMTPDLPFVGSGANYSTLDGSVNLWDALYISTSDRLTLTLLAGQAGVFVDLNVQGLAAFAPGMGSLPDDPAQYLPSDRLDAIVIDGANVLAGAWRSGQGMTEGSIRMTVRAFDAPSPEPEGCNAADLAPPFGVHDFDDVLAYLSAFGAGCP